jgi:hypothetical protein
MRGNKGKWYMKETKWKNIDIDQTKIATKYCYELNK